MDTKTPRMTLKILYICLSIILIKIYRQKICKELSSKMMDDQHTETISVQRVLFAVVYFCIFIDSRADLSNLTFTTMCIKESLRLHPPVLALTRYYSQDINVPEGRTVPEGN